MLAAMVWLGEWVVNTIYFYHIEHLKGERIGYDSVRRVAFVAQSYVPALWALATILLTRMRFGFPWAVILSLYLIRQLGFVVGSGLHFYLEHPFTSALLLASVVTTVAIDIRRGLKRGWLHWFGVGVALCGLGLRLSV